MFICGDFECDVLTNGEFCAQHQYVLLMIFEPEYYLRSRF